jgi:hypothetical protein
MKFPEGVTVEQVFTENSGDLTSEARRAIDGLVNKDILITLKGKVKFVGSRVLTFQATDAYDKVDTIGVRASDIVGLEFPNE